MRKTFLFSMLMLSVLIFNSCSNDDTVFSCDPTINEWVKNNRSIIKNMKRQDILDMGEEQLQRAVFVAFDEKQKYDLWEEKISEVLELNWSTEEQDHIKSLHAFITENKHIFDTGMTENDDIFMYKWTEKAKQKLNWDDNLIYGILATPNQLLDKSGTVKLNENYDNPLNKLRLGYDEEINPVPRQNCNCNLRSTVTCIGGYSCAYNGCYYVTRGCGGMWVQPCDANCFR